MDYSTQLIRETGPRNYLGHGEPYRSFGSGIPNMPIPGSSNRDEPPPPLPPPRNPLDHPMPYQGREPPRPFAPGSFSPRDHSLYGSFRSSFPDEETHKGGALAPPKDEGYESLPSTRSRDSLPTPFLGHNRFEFQSYGDSLKGKLNPSLPLDRPRSQLSASLNGDLYARRAPTDKPFPALSLPTRSRLPDDDGLRSAVSPRSAPFQFSAAAPERRLTSESIDFDRSPRRTRRQDSGSAPDDSTEYTQGSYDDDDMEVGRLRIDDHAHYQTKKRRASSPPDADSMPGIISQGDLVRRRDVPSRSSPTPRLGTIHQGSISSVSSVSSVRTTPYISNLSLAAGGASYGRRSPGPFSPGAALSSPLGTEAGCSSPCATPASLTHSPRTSISSSRAPRRGGEVVAAAGSRSPRKLKDVTKPSGHKIQGFWMCECCPKKPKKFETAEQLSAHEAEKQYECAYCGNRFKNKNEAERHQNSLHVRRHSWSCSALSGFDRAFYDSVGQPGHADTCGYCGDEFARTGRIDAVTGTPAVSERDWDDRIRHLQEVHKFRECNSSKKFYRADHFRQHLKHSHAGSSGKWTNMLENACMMDEEPPEPLSSKSSGDRSD